jgi:hypothetical protein
MNVVTAATTRRDRRNAGIIATRSNERTTARRAGCLARIAGAQGWQSGAAARRGPLGKRDAARPSPHVARAGRSEAQSTGQRDGNCRHYITSDAMDVLSQSNTRCRPSRIEPHTPSMTARARGRQKGQCPKAVPLVFERERGSSNGPRALETRVTRSPGRFRSIGYGRAMHRPTAVLAPRLAQTYGPGRSPLRTT